MRIALTREVPDRIVDCELTHLERMPIDLDRARAQHAEYEAALAAAGCVVERIAPAPELADSVFVEDAAVIFPELAVVTRPGAPSRRAETATVADAVGRYRPLHRIAEPGTLDGGDVLVAGQRVFVGVSSRTNEDGVRQLRDVLGPLGYTVAGIDTAACLHLKSAATLVTDDVLLVNPEWIDVTRFDGFRILEVDPSEPFAANVLRIDDIVICGVAAPLTRGRIEAIGVETIAVDVSELAKAEAGVTCCSLIIISDHSDHSDHSDNSDSRALR